MFGGNPFAGISYAGGDPDIPDQTHPILAVEVAFTTDALAEPAWVDISGDVRSWDTSRGRNRELERFQPGRATVVLGNLERQYDSSNEDGPWFGNLRPMRRIRIRETFNGVTYPVFDGFVDRWLLDYPGHGKDATATVIATDAFKVFNRTDLPLSVYHAEVLADSPPIYWRLDEGNADPTTTALNSGTLGATGNGTYVGPVTRRGEQGMVFHDPGTSIRVQDPGGLVDVPNMGVTIDDANFALDGTGSWAVEFWTTPAGAPIGGDVFCKDSGTKFVFGSTGSPEEFWQFLLINDSATIFGVTADAAGQVPNTIYHVVAKYGPNRDMAVYINGTKYTATAASRTAPPVTGTLDLGDLWFLFSSTAQTPEAVASHFAVYTSAEAVDPLPDERVTAHYEAGRTPWQDDLPGERLARLLDEVGWPAGRREIDDGAATLQSAQMGTTALEHMQKVGETEFGLLFVNRAGDVRLVARSALWDRQRQATFGDTPTAGWVLGTSVLGTSTILYGPEDARYRDIKFDDGDTVIRNRATISRLGGAAKTATDTDSVDEFGRFDFTLDGLLHRTDSYSEDYADFIVAEYAEPRRRVTSLVVGPAEPGDEADLYPAMLGRELGEVVRVQHHPPGGGDKFTQECVIEGVEISGAPKRLTAKFVLSPVPSNEF